MMRRGRRRLWSGGRSVAFRARCGGVAASKVEACLLMPGQGERGGPERIHGVAELTAIEVRRGDELAPVGIFVAIDTGVVLDVIYGVRSGGEGASRARNRGVVFPQRGLPPFVLGFGGD